MSEVRERGGERRARPAGSRVHQPETEVRARNRLRHGPHAGQARSARIRQRGRRLIPHREEERGELGGCRPDALRAVGD